MQVTQEEVLEAISARLAALLKELTALDCILDSLENSLDEE